MKLKELNYRPMENWNNNDDSIKSTYRNKRDKELVKKFDEITRRSK